MPSPEALKGWLVLIIMTGISARYVPVTPGTVHGRIGRWGAFFEII